ncbi:hypothetical protein F5H01DRAFT_357862 [Linnemannia elongata]|nr:hypothetical protein F5H01DRAFT_357862 [Linnemannia elongata]
MSFCRLWQISFILFCLPSPSFLFFLSSHPVLVPHFCSILLSPVFLFLLFVSPFPTSFSFYILLLPHNHSLFSPFL